MQDQLPEALWKVSHRSFSGLLFHEWYRHMDHATRAAQRIKQIFGCTASIEMVDAESDNPYHAIALRTGRSPLEVTA